MAANRQVVQQTLSGMKVRVDISVSPLEKEGDTASSYQLTLDNGRLTEEQRRHYEENGFLVVKKLVPDELLDKFRARFLDIVDGRVPKSQMTMMKDIALRGRADVPQERVVNKLQDWVWDDVLSQFVLLPQILDLVEGFLGENIMAMHTMLINKPPDAGTKTSRHPMHQDLHYFPFRPADRIVCAWTAMERVHQQNGCLFVVPGSHRIPLQPHEYPEWQDGVNKMYHGVRGYDDQAKLYVEMEKGDTVFFHPLLLHGSGANITQGFRKAISCHFAASECHYIDVRGTSQQSLADEVMKLAEKRGISVDDISFADIWRFRSRLVRGKQAKL
ncbi:phytanoyl-CoA dioxygenase, peroxisomal-like isoform X2 [Amphibalanus amphitrite]|nr:phytanoyl-CoA dioxygenase, peroxisomal-like isoform X2 [Amphibalanus amphitrite]XP_043194894.1 phytanoyl-CoA dioxygenase, peroxisomal-like isoform X2 [Amphibalanus amphitrite]XP_043194895.1 phytanoyl-CoA dioxygenase, peroxisomal-like isoform X2 [Amphibalanus amphitrite]XP_043194896.1 phytanoyl-CoA dioxygenase, peroxisomal-like isoform X2 [Amphibalanus amphitrite]XP_043194897.1 phytanoyl-CoA dioxygenase, peroxisomal-like isoform X2 [Amphibalanus amphitrite]XP_043194898.1 phytanoyl-CoA dioxyg